MSLRSYTAVKLAPSMSEKVLCEDVLEKVTLVCGLNVGQVTHE